jgi:predicted  nucleic acid-binding Zn-ribbon protein
MHDDLERVIALQQLDTTAESARRRLADEPERDKALTARLDLAREQQASAKTRLADNQTARRNIEKDVAMHQGRLSKFREQAMAVKTNQEYHAIQKEISFAQGEIKTLEDKILEQMLEADELTGALKKADLQLTGEQKAIETAQREMTAEHGELEASLARIAGERAALIAGLSPQLLLTFEQVSRKRNGVAVAEARDGICTICHVRLRPQIFNTVRRNEQIVQCDSCNRILYFVPAAAASAAPSDATAASPEP